MNILDGRVIKSAEELRGFIGARMPGDDWLTVFSGNEAWCLGMMLGARLIGVEGAALVLPLEIRDSKYKKRQNFVAVWAVPKKNAPTFPRVIEVMVQTQGYPWPGRREEQDIFLLSQPGAPKWVLSMGASFLDWIKTGKGGEFHHGPSSGV